MKDNMKAVGIAILIIALMILGVLFYYAILGVVLIVVALLFGKMYVLGRKEYLLSEEGKVRKPSKEEWWTD